MNTLVPGFLAIALLVPQAARAERILRHEAILDASVKEVWEAFTTSEGARHWMAPVAEVDLRIGGTIKTNYNPQARIGDPGTIVHHILSYEPERMITTRFTAPEGAPTKAKAAQAVWWVARLEPLPDGRTRLTYTGVGWGQGPVWDEAYEFFDRGNAWTFQQLGNYLRKKAEPWGGEHALLAGKRKTDRAITLEQEVACSPDEVIRLWTTEEGVKKFLAPAARIEARPGGAYTMIFDPQNDPEGNSRGTNGARILRVVPGRELAFEWIPFVLDDGLKSPGPPPAPASLRNAKPLPTWVELSFDPLGNGGTLVRLAHYGFQHGDPWDAAFAYFQKAWAGVLEELSRQCAPQKRTP